MSSSSLRTLDKSSAEFESYLWGAFSNTQRALPVQTLNANSKSESVTFRIVEASQIQRPGLLPFLVQTFKARNFILVLFPLFWILSKNLGDGNSVDPVSAVISTLGILCAFISLGLKNDIADHFRGIDRILTDRGSRAIQKGWLTARQVQKYSWFFLALSLACALMIVVVWPQAAVIFAISLVFGLWSYLRGGGIPLFFLLGPLLTAGYQLSFGGLLSEEVVMMGILWGWLVLYLRYLKNFLHIVPSSQAGFRNTVNRLGFDHSRRGIALWWLAFLALNFLFHVRLEQIEVGVVESVLLLIPTIWFLVRLKQLSSPVGSKLLSVYRGGRYLFAFAVGLWTLESFWLLL